MIQLRFTFFLSAMILVFAVGVFAQSKAEISIRKVLDEQTAAWNRGDVEGFMAGYWKSEKMVFISGNNVARGWQAALDRYKKNYDSKAKMGNLSFSDLEMTILSKDAAVVVGRFTLVRENDKPTGMFSLTFRKFKEGWRIIIDHTS